MYETLRPSDRSLLATASAASTARVLSALSVLLQGDVIGHLPSGLLTDLLRLVQDLVVVRRASLVAGETDPPFISSDGFDNLRVSSGMFYYKRMPDLILAAPLTSLEAYHGLTGLTSVMSSDDLTAANSLVKVGTGLVEFAR